MNDDITPIDPVDVEEPVAPEEPVVEEDPIVPVEPIEPEDPEVIIEPEFLDQFTDTQKVRYTELAEMFRTSINDYDAEKNILAGKKLDLKDTEVYRYFKRAMADINKGAPPTDYTIFTFPKKHHGLLIDAAFIFYCIANGVLQLRNQLDYNNAGLTVALFNKTGGYQQWASYMMQMYSMDKKEFKRSVIVDSPGAGFVGVGSEFGYYAGWWD